MNPINVEIVKTNPALTLPTYGTSEAAGCDLRASEAVTVPAHGRVLVPTGLKVGLPMGWQLEIRPRSGKALKEGLTVLNTPGTIDSDYRGEIKVILFNTTGKDYEVSPGEAIAQAVLMPAYRIEWVEVDELPTTSRGSGGFGSTGK